jgi:hypothetical protein
LKIHLGADPDFRAARKAHAALVVDGLDTLVATLELRDIPLGAMSRSMAASGFTSMIPLVIASN